MQGDASQPSNARRGLHRWSAEQGSGGSWFSEEDISDPNQFGGARLEEARSGEVPPEPGQPARTLSGTEQPGESTQTIEQRYADAIAAMNQIVATLDFSTLPWVTQVFRATAGFLHEQDPARAGVLNNLGSASQLTYLRSGDLDDLEDAVSYYRSAVTTARVDDPDLVLYQCNLTLALTDQAARASTPEPAADAVDAGRSALQRASRNDPRRVMALVRLGNALKLHSQQAGDTGSNDESIDVFREAVRSTPRAGSVETADLVSSLGGALLRRYERARAVEDLDEAINQLHAGINSLADGESRRSALCEFAHALRLRFQHSGNLADITAAINELVGLLGLLDSGHPLLGRVLWNLAATVVEHVDSTGEPDQLRSALSSMAPAVRGMTTGDPHRALALATYGALLRRHFLYGAEPLALDTAVAAGEAAAEVVGPEQCGAVLNSLTTTLVICYEHSGDTINLDRASQIADRAASNTPQDSASQHTARAQQGIIAAHRFRRSSETGELDLAIERLDQALTAMPETEPGRAAIATHLGRALRTLHQRTGRRWLYRWTRRVLTGAAALPSAPSDQRLRAASLCGRLAAQSQRWSEAVESFTTAVELLPLVTWGKRVVASASAQQHWATITADAVACALQDGEKERAVELLEHGRTAILADFLPTGGEVGRLYRDMPDLADETIRLRRLLDRPAEEPALSELATGGGRDRLVRAWTTLLEEIRTVPGHEDHLRPVPFRELTAPTKDGAVVLLNVSRYRSDALIVFAGRVLVVPLPKVTPESAAVHASEVLNAAQHRDSQALAHVLDWLWRNIAQPVLSRMGYVRAPAAGERWPRIWWSSMGALAFAPLHAASSRSGESALDRVISSYTPSLGTLRRAQRRKPTSTGPALVAAGSSERIARELPLENRILARYWPNAEIVSVETATSADMLGLLPQYPWLHICEPGAQHPAEPASSLLLDRDSPDRPLGLLEVGQLSLEATEFGYLGGPCPTTVETPTGAAMPLVGALAFSGFAHTAGPLWEVDRDTAVRVQSDVYGTLFGTNSADTEWLAHALHTAAHRARGTYPDQPERWAAYVHVGP